MASTKAPSAPMAAIFLEICNILDPPWVCAFNRALLDQPIGTKGEIVQTNLKTGIPVPAWSMTDPPPRLPGSM
ncbi:hypothetical protein [Pseudoponticoccus marisrubri]|uniref:hypothetical protein n=1 Tax=Pseudoponticoccus marisrubri TaxID=1685382 RepID=UPI0012FD779C|nr:hypothetical protein [Pseudoponticoccus marisrubri]